MVVMRQKKQLELPFMADPRGEAPRKVYQGIETPMAKGDPENPAITEQLMEVICLRKNMYEAYKRVKANNGSPGADGMTVNELGPYLNENWETIREQLLKGTYEPQPVMKVEVPKPNGGTRTLGVPVVVDRLIQQMVLQVLQPEWDPTFSNNSFGFRPGRSTRQAVSQAQKYIQEG